jgi:Cu-processing system ATP-binding protein
MILQVERLTKRYGRVEAVRDISFGVAPGEVFALLGPNGSGKTTTLKCIVGLNIPTTGKIMIDGVDALADPVGARRSISFLPQRVVFPETLSAREVLQFHARLRGLPAGAIEEGLRAARFNGAADRRVGEYSGGMVQRLGLAVAAMPSAPVLVLDEPTASLDPEGVIRFREFVNDQRSRGTTVVFSTHLLTEVEQLADRVAVFVGGRIVACTDIGEIRRTFLANGTVEDMYLHYVGGAHDAP